MVVSKSSNPQFESEPGELPLVGATAIAAALGMSERDLYRKLAILPVWRDAPRRSLHGYASALRKALHARQLDHDSE
jgi:hypothetical protein